jgi:glutathione S-transferase
MAKYLLVSFKTCPWVQRAAIVLREKKIDFEFRHIEPDNRPDWFLAISPHKKVPVLRVDDSVSLFESNAIVEYLDETVAPRLHPNDPIDRAVSGAWTDYVPSFAETVTGAAYADTEADYNKAVDKIPVPFERPIDRGTVRQRQIGLSFRRPGIGRQVHSRRDSLAALHSAARRRTRTFLAVRRLGHSIGTLCCRGGLSQALEPRLCTREPHW